MARRRNRLGFMPRRRWLQLRGRKWGRFGKVILVLALMAAVLLPIYVFYLDYHVRKIGALFRWEIPARVYARPLELFAGRALTPDQFETELRLLGYRYGPKLLAGNYIRHNNDFQVITREFQFWDGQEKSVYLNAHFSRIGIDELKHGISGEALPLVRMDPVMIGSLYPKHKEDRILVRLDEVPAVLLQALLAIEDRSFYTHYGVDPKGVLRAVWANLRAHRMVQGGSTLTQQLVKNFYLNSKRTFTRKLNELVMSLLLEYHFDKKAILEAYCNEIYLGQDGDRAIHGFGLASWFYFQRPLRELKVAEVALLVGMVRGPSYYDPRRYEQRAKDRRDHVLDTLEQMKVIDAQDADAAKASPLGIQKHQSGSTSRFPAFIDLVRRQLQRDYREEDLSSEGLNIFTTLDPLVQVHAEKALSHSLETIEKSHQFAKDTLESAAVISGVENGEVLAVVGGRRAGYSGFNRALDAVRQVGSLMKPAVFLTALEQPDKYTLSSLIDDSPLEYKMSGGRVWAPLNYDKENHGNVSIQMALAESLNVATARLGLEVGIAKVLNTIKRLGVERELDPFPSVLLGAATLTPLEVTQMYQTMASGGFRTPLRAIREVLTAKGSLLQRYDLDVQRTFDRAPVYLIDRALQSVVTSGTGRAMYNVLPQEFQIAGKTGTTDDLRDSWFAGFSGNYVAAVWVGRDDNKSSGLTGASGALRVWANIFAGLNVQALEMNMPDNVGEEWVDEQTNTLAAAGCEHAVRMPYIEGSAPKNRSDCNGSVINGLIKRVFE